VKPVRQYSVHCMLYGAGEGPEKLITTVCYAGI
jgi:hypothetical protein